MCGLWWDWVRWPGQWASRKQWITEERVGCWEWQLRGRGSDPGDHCAIYHTWSDRIFTATKLLRWNFSSRTKGSPLTGQVDSLGCSRAWVASLHLHRNTEQQLRQLIRVLCGEYDVYVHVRDGIVHCHTSLIHFLPYTDWDQGTYRFVNFFLRPDVVCPLTPSEYGTCEKWASCWLRRAITPRHWPSSPGAMGVSHFGGLRTCRG